MAILDNDISLEASAVVSSDIEECTSDELSHVFHIEVTATRDIYRVTDRRILYRRVPEAAVSIKSVDIASVKQEVLAVVARHNTPITCITYTGGAILLNVDERDRVRIVEIIVVASHRYGVRNLPSGRHGSRLVLVIGRMAR